MTDSQTGRPTNKVRICVTLLAALQTFGALTDLPALFIDYGHDTRLLIFAQALTSVKIALTPLFTGAAFYFALKDRVPAALMTLAALILLGWLTELPSLAIHGLDLSPNFGGALSIATYFLAPLIAITAGVLAWRNERLGLATFLVALPFLSYLAGVAIFAVGVMIYGF